MRIPYQRHLLVSNGLRLLAFRDIWLQAFGGWKPAICKSFSIANGPIEQLFVASRPANLRDSLRYKRLYRMTLVTKNRYREHSLCFHRVPSRDLHWSRTDCENCDQDQDSYCIVRNSGRSAVYRYQKQLKKHQELGLDLYLASMDIQGKHFKKIISKMTKPLWQPSPIRPNFVASHGSIRLLLSEQQASCVRKKFLWLLLKKDVSELTHGTWWFCSSFNIL